MTGCTACTEAAAPAPWGERLDARRKLDHRSLLSTRPLPALLPVDLLIVLPPDAGPRRPPDNIFFLLFPRPLLLLLAFLPSNLNTGQVLAVLVPKNIPRRI